MMRIIDDSDVDWTFNGYPTGAVVLEVDVGFWWWKRTERIVVARAFAQDWMLENGDLFHDSYRMERMLAARRNKHMYKRARQGNNGGDGRGQ